MLLVSTNQICFITIIVCRSSHGLQSVGTRAHPRFRSRLRWDYLLQFGLGFKRTSYPRYVQRCTKSPLYPIRVMKCGLPLSSTRSCFKLEFNCYFRFDILVLQTESKDSVYMFAVGQGRMKVKK